MLVTGAWGAIGSVVLHELLDNGLKPIAFDLQEQAVPGVSPGTDIPFVRGDVRDTPLLRRTIERYSAKDVIHLAALLPDACQKNPSLAAEINVMSVANICELARTGSVRRIVFASSKGVLKRIDEDHAAPTYRPVDERHPVGPDNVYDVTKYCAEQLGINYANSHGVDFLAFRFAATYGPGRGSRHGALAIRSTIVEDAYNGVPVHIPRGGDQLDDFVYTKDVAQALVRGIMATGTQDRVFHIGTGKPSSLRQAAQILARHIPGADITVGPGLDYGTGNGRYCIFDIGAAQRELGYEPRFDHEAGIIDYLDTLAASAELT